MRNLFRYLFSERRALRRELEALWATRQHCDTREPQINARIAELSLREVNNAIPTRSTRGW